jgi:hypothetical protein
MEGQEVVTRAQYVNWLRRSKKPVFNQYAPPPASPSLATTGLSGAASSATEGMFTVGSGGRYQRARDQPKWNKRFNAAVQPGHINDVLPNYAREYFSEPMEVAELERFYDSYRGFRSNNAKLHQSKPQPARPALMPRSLSTGLQTLMTLPGRHSPAGTMHSHKRGQHGKREVTPWVDNFVQPLGLRQYGPPSEQPLPPLATFSGPEHRRKKKGYLPSDRWSDHFFPSKTR